ncbi:MAG: hypothetical protein ABJC26_00750 [Gemmatimonadaceae bacterium]
MKRILCSISCLALFGELAAQKSHAQQAIPIRTLGQIEAVSSEPFKNVLNVRAMSNGNLLVNDGLRRMVVMLDSTLALSAIVLDSASGTANGYGPRATAMIAYLGDSSLFVDGVGQSLLMIDTQGAVSRILAAPRPRDLRFLAGSMSGVDGYGNLLYMALQGSSSNAPVIPGQPAPPPSIPDSAAIVRANFATRLIDTIGRVRVPSTTQTNSVQRGDGRMLVTKRINPVTTPDEWAVLSDGTVAFVRGHDYHVDFLDSNGHMRASSKLPFDWKRLTDADKQGLVDSARTAEEELIRKAKEARRSSIATPPGAVPMPDPVLQFVPFKEMGDYYPAIRYGAAKADLDGNLWILPTTSAQSIAGELVYDVVNREGELSYRVRVPSNRSIAGFGRGGVIYLMYRDDAQIWHIERRRAIRSSHEQSPDTR